MILRLSKFDKSQKAHLRLMVKHNHSSVTDPSRKQEHRIKESYHTQVMGVQARSRKILSKSERRKIFQNVSRSEKSKKKTISNPYDDFDWTPTGYIKGHYIDGKFEPD